MYIIRKAWLESVGEMTWKNSKYGVRFKKIDNESGWYLYETMHSSKHKKEQLGWEGKQWGIWCRAQFVERVPEKKELSEYNYSVLCRRLRRWSRTRVRNKKLRPFRISVTRNGTFCIKPEIIDKLSRGLVLDESHIIEITNQISCSCSC